MVRQTVEPIYPGSSALLQPLVSIVLPTYNRADRLPRALQSCLRQTHHNLEVIVVDDGSTDETPQVVAAIQREDSRVRYFRQENQKLPAALNAGFRHSRGEYLTWTSDDNQYQENAVEIMAKALDESPSVGLVYCDFDEVSDEGHLLRRVHLQDPEHLPERNCIVVCFMYRRQVYEVVGDYDSSYLLAEDYDYWFRVSEHFEIQHIHGVSPYNYIKHEESLSTRHQHQVFFAIIRVRLKHGRTWSQKLVVFITSRGEAAQEYAGMGDWPKAILSAIVFVVCEPWRRWKWLHAFRIFRSALSTWRHARQQET